VATSTNEPPDWDPTATHELVPKHDRPFSAPVGLGLGDDVHDVPSQVSIVAPPTATQSIELAQLMALMAPGLATVDQVAPFQA